MASRRVVRKPLLSDQDKQDAMLLYLTHCRYENKYNKILLNGYNIKGETVGFVVENYQRYFFLQFHSTEMNSTQYPDRINSYLRWMERQARVIKAFHLPKQGDINHQQSQYNPIFNDKELPAGDKFHLISKWKTVDNQYKTMYGWTPDMLQNIIQVWVNEPKVCDAMCYFIESTVFLKIKGLIYFLIYCYTRSRIHSCFTNQNAQLCSSHF